MKTSSFSDGGGFNMYGYWKRQPFPLFGATWLVHVYLSTCTRAPAVVDDFGNLVAVP